MDSFPKQLR